MASHSQGRKIRLAQRGKKKNRTFRVIVADSRSPRDGKFIEYLGFYNPKDINSDIAYEFKPNEGNIILFSTELDHSVPMYEKDDVRITFAFNLGVKNI